MPGLVAFAATSGDSGMIVTVIWDRDQAGLPWMRVS